MLIKTMEWVMDGVSAAYKVAEREGLTDPMLLPSSCQLEVSTHHGMTYQVAWFKRLRTGAKILNISSHGLQIEPEEKIRAMLLNCFASYLQWCEHDLRQAQWASAAHHEIRKVQKPKVPTYGDGTWARYWSAVDKLWRAR